MSKKLISFSVTTVAGVWIFDPTKNFCHFVENDDTLIIVEDAAETAGGLILKQPVMRFHGDYTINYIYGE